MFSGHRREGLALLEGAVLDARAHGQHFAPLRGPNNLASATGRHRSARVARADARRAWRWPAASACRRSTPTTPAMPSAAAERLGEWAWAASGARRARRDRPGPIRRRLDRRASRLPPRPGRANRTSRVPNDCSPAALAESDYPDRAQSPATGWPAASSRPAGRSGAASGRSRSSATPSRKRMSGDFAMVGAFALHAGRLDVARRVLELANDHLRRRHRPRPVEPARRDRRARGSRPGGARAVSLGAGRLPRRRLPVRRRP